MSDFRNIIIDENTGQQLDSGLNSNSKITGPTATDDSSKGYNVNSEWIDTTNNKYYKCVDASVGAAVWIQINDPTAFEYMTIKIVQTLADFPAPVGNEIFLENNLIYFIDNSKLDITGYTLVFNQRSQINGFGQNVSGISSSTNGASVANPYVFFKSTTNLFMNDLEIFCEGTNQRIWDHVGSGVVPEGESFELNRFNVLCFEAPGHNNALGRIKNIRQGFIGTISFIGFEDGFKLQDSWTGGFRVDNTIFINCKGKFFYSDPLDPVTFARRVSSNANISVPLGSIGYDFPPTAFSFTGQYQLQNGNASGLGQYVTDWFGISPAFNKLANFQNNTGIQDTFQGGEWVNSITTTTSIIALGSWVPLNVVTINKFLTWFTELNGVFTYEGGNPLDVTMFLTLSLTGQANNIIEVRIMKESALAVLTVILTRQITIQGTLAQGRAESVPIIATEQLVEGDMIYVQIRNLTSAQNVDTLENSNFVIGAK